MNIKRAVWLPPDGDPRLVRFQQDLARLVGLVDGAPLPPHIERLSVDRPRGVVFFGPWTVVDHEPTLEAWDEGGQFGLVRFGLLDGRRWAAADLAGLPPPPDWRWTKGVTAHLTVRLPEGDPSFTLWSWAARRGWKGDPPKG